jgi:hypothetical protein
VGGGGVGVAVATQAARAAVVHVKTPLTRKARQPSQEARPRRLARHVRKTLMRTHNRPATCHRAFLPRVSPRVETAAASGAAHALAAAVHAPVVVAAAVAAAVQAAFAPTKTFAPAQPES